VLIKEEVVLARTDQGDGLTRVMVEYVMSYVFRIIINFLLQLQ
jgi:hypothetical protein